jgi:hypothetical protein
MQAIVYLQHTMSVQKSNEVKVFPLPPNALAP